MLLAGRMQYSPTGRPPLYTPPFATPDPHTPFAHQPLNRRFSIFPPPHPPLLFRAAGVSPRKPPKVRPTDPYFPFPISSRVRTPATCRGTMCMIKVQAAGAMAASVGRIKTARAFEVAR